MSLGWVETFFGTSQYLELKSKSNPVCTKKIQIGQFDTVHLVEQI